MDGAVNDFSGFPVEDEIGLPSDVGGVDRIAENEFTEATAKLGGQGTTELVRADMDPGFFIVECR